jgi:hypothetical protein
MGVRKGIGFLFEQDNLVDIASGNLIRILEDWTRRPPGSASITPAAETSRRE